MNAFATNFGVRSVRLFLSSAASDRFANNSYGLNQVREWQDIAKEAFKAVFIMLILERLYVSSPVSWLEGATAVAVGVVMGGEPMLSSHLHSTHTHAPPQSTSITSPWKR